MGNIEKISRIKKETLNSEYYFESLLEQAYAKGMLSDTHLEKIQFDCLVLLARQTEQYSRGESSSVRIETAQNLMGSIMFTIGVGLKEFASPDDSIAAVQIGGVAAIYQKGRNRIDKMIKQAKRLYAALVCNLIKTDNVFYASTVVDGIKGFFKLYDPRFAAQEIHITVDYPVHHQMGRLLGIEFIKEYLKCIYYENMFCAKFSEENIRHLLCGYDEHYEELLFNIYEQVLTAAIGCILSGCNVRGIAMKPESIEILNNLFWSKTRAEIGTVLKDAASRLGGILDLSESLNRYIVMSLPQIAVSIENAVVLQTLSRVFILPKYPENDPKIMVPVKN